MIMSARLLEIRGRLKRFENKRRAEFSLRYFKTGPGEYGEGVRFLGVATPDLRKLAREFRDAEIRDLQALLRSEMHEERSLSLLILTARFVKADTKTREQIYRFYFKNIRFIDNWDLVDLSAPIIVGGFLADKDRRPLHELAVSPSLWERRIAIIATQHFIRHNEFVDTLRISRVLLEDSEDLIHKAVGWMLREIGNRDLDAEEVFLRRHYKRMPRTMLRYAIEKFPEAKRQKYLRGRV